MIELGQRPGFLQKLLHAVAEMLAVGAGVRADRQPVEMAAGDVARQVFLDRHESGQLAVPAEIGDAEAAGFAENLTHQVLSVHQGRAGWQQQRTLRGVFVKPARRTDSILQSFLKTGRANHDRIPLYHFTGEKNKY